MSGTNYFPTPTVLPPSQPIGGGMGTSPLAAAILGKPSNFSLPQTAGTLPAPLMSMLMQQIQQQGANGDPSMLQQGVNGIGNVLNGYQWNGMPGTSQMGVLNAQAGANMAGMPQGAPTDPYGSMGAFGGYGNGPV